MKKNVLALMAVLVMLLTVGAGTAFAAVINGTNDRDRLTGTAAGDVIYAFGGDDLVIGLGGSDQLSGGPNKDTIYGNTGNDSIGGGANDDLLFGNEGNDTIQANEGSKDHVDCGPGVDTAVVDSKDTTANCENVSLR